MIKINQKIKGILSAAILLGIFALCVTTAWATISFVKPSDSNPEFLQQEKVQSISVEKSAKNKARAPEPTTMALFGSGFLGMIVSFIRKTYAAAKRAFDVIFSALALVLLSPVLLFIALLVKLTSKGPIFYTQERVGKDGSLFNMFKIRTMNVDAEKETGPVWAAQNDSRLTPIGGILRKLHIDEIPQFINVIMGDMSIIGPRPERKVFVEKFMKEIPDYGKRLNVKPGITGLAQVWHRYDETIEDVKKKVKYDLLYIKKMCFWADFSIFLRTFRVVITGEGAR